MKQDKAKAIQNRLSRIMGHIKSISHMVEDERECTEVMIQLAAVKAALNNVGKELMKDYISESVDEILESGDKEKLEELNRAIEMFMK